MARSVPDRSAYESKPRTASVSGQPRPASQAAVAFGEAAGWRRLPARPLAFNPDASSTSIESLLACSMKPAGADDGDIGVGSIPDQFPATGAQPPGGVLGVDLVGACSRASPGDAARRRRHMAHCSWARVSARTARGGATRLGRMTLANWVDLVRCRPCLFDGHKRPALELRELVSGDFDALDVGVRPPARAHRPPLAARVGGVGAQFWSVYVRQLGAQ